MDVQKATESVLLSAKTGKTPKMNFALAVANISNIRDKLRKKFGSNIGLIDQPDDWRKNPTVICELLEDYYQEILALPLAEAGNVLRYLFTETKRN
jgi:hypothetical protein